MIMKVFWFVLTLGLLGGCVSTDHGFQGSMFRIKHLNGNNNINIIIGDKHEESIFGSVP